MVSLARNGDRTGETDPNKGASRLSLVQPTRTTPKSTAFVAALTEDKSAEPIEEPRRTTLSRPLRNREDTTPRFLRGGTDDRGRSPLCYLCWKPGHMPYQCFLLTDRQKEMVREARESFVKSTGSRNAGTDEKGQYRRSYNKQLRVAMVQAIFEGIDRSDEEAGAEAVSARRTDGPSSSDKTGSGNV